MFRFFSLALLALIISVDHSKLFAADSEKHYLYVAAPGIRDYLEFGGAGVLVFDINDHFRFVKRIDTPASKKAKPENIKGICACAQTRRLYFTTLTRLYCLDLTTDQPLWDHDYPGGCDRMAMTPDGKYLYVPSLEKDHWHVVDGQSGKIVSKIEPKSGSHNTVCSLDGTRVYCAGLKSNLLTVVDTKTQEIVGTVGPFTKPIRPFTVDGSKSKCYCNVNDLLGFEIGDLKTGKMVQRVEVKGYSMGPVKRHGCPSHGVGLTPDEKEVWVVDGHNNAVHVFDNTVMPPKQGKTITLREQPGWITFSLDGKYALLSTGEVIDTKTKTITDALKDEKGREVHSEKMVEIHFKDGVPIRNGDQFGVGRVSTR